MYLIFHVCNEIFIIKLFEKIVGSLVYIFLFELSVSYKEFALHKIEAFCSDKNFSYCNDKLH